MLAETVNRFLGDLASVAHAKGVLLPRPHAVCRSAEHSALGQDARMVMMVILPPRQGCDLLCIVSSEASLMFSLPRCCCLAYVASLDPQLVCPLLNLLPRHATRALFGAHDHPVHCGLVRGLARVITWCSAYECPSSRHNLSCCTPLDPQLVCPLLTSCRVYPPRRP